MILVIASYFKQGYYGWMHKSCLAKHQMVVSLFSDCETKEAKYDKIILLGRELPPLDPAYKTETALVRGCQGSLYLHTTMRGDGTLSFEAQADALISAGLAALLILAYNEEPPEAIIMCEPLFLKQLDIDSLLSPSRSNGLYSLHLRMKQDATKHIMNKI